MASVLSTAMSRLNAFLDSEMEQILCFDSTMDTETFCNSKSAIFIVLPEEDSTKYFMVSLFLQQIYREMLSIADEQMCIRDSYKTWISVTDFLLSTQSGRMMEGEVHA